jgi:hypothetical protein
MKSGWNAIAFLIALGVLARAAAADMKITLQSTMTNLIESLERKIAA